MDKDGIEKIILKFLEKTVHNQGSISVQNLTGHFSQLPADIRKRFKCNKAEVRKFLMAYPQLFIVNDEVVSVAPRKGQHNLISNSIQEVPTLVSVEDDDGDGGSGGDDDDDDDDDDAAEKRTELVDCKGKVIRKFDIYGFIEYSSSPSLTATVYFDVICFEDGQTETFNKLKLNDEVNFNAKPSFGHKAHYRATKVWRCGCPMSLQGSEKCYSSSTSLASQDSYQSDTLNGAGIVMKIAPNYGFIKPAGKIQGNIFFFRTKLHLPNVAEVKNLEEVVKKGDFLYFSAIPSRKKNTDARWEATKVSRTPIESSWNGLLQNSEKNNRVRAGSTSSTDCSFVSSGFETDRITDENHIYDQVGSIQNLSSSEPSILFGKNEIAVVPLNVVYKNNILTQELGWEFDEGTKVQFNAERVNGDWRATLVWIGEKPILSTKKSHRKKNTKTKESTISDLCEISLYDDGQTDDDGIWHTTSHIDVNSWDEENSENWPALEPPLSTKIKCAEEVKLSEAENNAKLPKSGLVNTLSVKNEEKSNDEAGSDGSKEISKSNKSHKKQRTCDTFSYATAVTTSSKYCQQSQNDSNSECERLKKYKMNNGWEENSFDANSEKWPAIDEPLVAKPVATTSKDTFKSLNGYQCFTQEQTPGKLEYPNFVDTTSDLQENYYSDDEESACEIVSDYSYNKNLTVINSRSLNSLPQKTRYDKFSDITGVVTNIQKHFAFIKYSKSDENLIFCWEQAFCDGQLVSKYYTDLLEVFNELDEVNFTYCRMIDENGKEWTNVLQVWKGEKPLLTTEYVKQNEAVPQLGSTNTASNKAVNVPAEAIRAATTSPGLLPTAVAVQYKSSTEDSGISMEEPETHENSCKSASSVCSFTSSIPSTSWNKEKDALSDVGFLANELRAASESSQKEKVTTCDAVSKFLNNVLRLTPSSVSESASCSVISQDGVSISTRNQKTQTVVTTHEEGTQTFITGTVLSVAVFPQ